MINGERYKPVYIKITGEKITTPPKGHFCKRIQSMSLKFCKVHH